MKSRCVRSGEGLSLLTEEWRTDPVCRYWYRTDSEQTHQRLQVYWPNKTQGQEWKTHKHNTDAKQTAEPSYLSIIQWHFPSVISEANHRELYSTKVILRRVATEMKAGRRRRTRWCILHLFYFFFTWFTGRNADVWCRRFNSVMCPLPRVTSHLSPRWASCGFSALRRNAMKIMSEEGETGTLPRTCLYGGVLEEGIISVHDYAERFTQTVKPSHHLLPPRWYEVRRSFWTRLLLSN